MESLFKELKDLCDKVGNKAELRNWLESVDDGSEVGMRVVKKRGRKVPQDLQKI